MAVTAESEVRPKVILFLLSLVALIARAVLAYSGGISADEGFVNDLVTSPSWSGMVSFLRFHESHPPLFYLLERGWMAIAGTSDATAMILPLMLGVLLVPVTFVVARSLFSRRTGLIAAALVAISPSLTEHSAQLRPYGLLPLLTLLSCYWLIVALEKGGWKRWAAFAVSTALLLYTHNWAWLIAGGQTVAAGVVIFKAPREHRIRQTREWFVAWLGIALAYAPWFTALWFQLGHAGHRPLPLDGPGDWIGFVLFGLASIPNMLFLGSYPPEKVLMFGVAGLAAAVSLLALRFQLGMAQRYLARGAHELPGSSLSKTALRIMLIGPLVTLAAAIVLSPRSNLLFDRCVASLAPLILVAIAHWFDTLRPAASASQGSYALSIAPPVFLIALCFTGIIALLPTTRSNAREVAGVVTSRKTQGDLVIVVPEWYAPSFNHYFKPSIEQIDYPHAARSGMIDFADVEQRRADTVALERLRVRIVGARARGRRVWLVSARRYVAYGGQEINDTTTPTMFARISPLQNVNDVRSLLISTYGLPDTTLFVRGKPARYDELLPFLFSAKPPIQESIR